MRGTSKISYTNGSGVSNVKSVTSHTSTVTVKVAYVCAEAYMLKK